MTQETFEHIAMIIYLISGAVVAFAYILDQDQKPVFAIFAFIFTPVLNTVAALAIFSGCVVRFIKS